MSSSARKRGAARERLVVVLGMHRSGTSAIARGLEVLGVRLGERLMPPAAGNNEKGFFEDLDVNALCQELLATLGRRWDSLDAVTAAELGRARVAPLRARAEKLLRERLLAMPVFGMKDPRISVLLPFWRPLFEAVAGEVDYVLCTRHPLSVARSLERRDGFPLEKSAYLWLQHMSRCVLDTAGAPRCVVSYDLVMAEPAAQVARIARMLGLKSEPDPEALRLYAEEFLSDDLRHSTHAASDLASSASMPARIAATHRLLEQLARDQVPMDAPQVQSFFAANAAVLDEMRPALAYASRLESHVARFDPGVEVRGLAEREAQLKDHDAMVAAKDAEIVALHEALAGRDTRVHELNLLMAQQDRALQELRAAVDAKDVHIVSMHERLAARDSRVHELDLALAEREARIEGLRAVLEQRERTASAALDSSRNALRIASQSLRGQVDSEARQLAHAVRAGTVSAAQGRAVRSLARIAEAYAQGLREVAATFDVANGEEVQAPELVGRISAMFEVRMQVWRDLAEFAETIDQAARSSAGDTELARLRFVESLRGAARAREESARLRQEYAQATAHAGALQSRIAALDHVEAQLQQREQVLGQLGHRVVSRLGRLLRLTRA